MNHSRSEWSSFIKDIGVYLHRPLNFNDNYFAAGLAVIVVIYFWWKNTQGIHESSQKALQIMIITTVMVVILIIWCTITVLRGPIQLPPSPLHAGVVPLNKESLGWLDTTWFRHLPLGILTTIILGWLFYRFAQQDADVLLPVENVAQGRCDLSRRERPGCDLIKQGLKKVEVPAVDQGDLDR